VPRQVRLFYPTQRRPDSNGTPTIASFCREPVFGDAKGGPLSGRKTPFSAIGPLSSGCRGSPYSACSRLRGMTDRAHSAGCSDHLQFCFLVSHRQAFPGGKFFVNKFSLPRTCFRLHGSTPTRACGWSFLSRQPFEISRNNLSP